jgi:hypothetical protein
MNPNILQVILITLDNNQIDFKKVLFFTGFIVSGVLILLILSRVDWSLFFSTIQQIKIVWILFSALLIITGVVIRSLRWNIITTSGIEDIKSFWEATNLGILGNLIYPARAGEFLRIVAINQFLKIPEGRAISSAVVDRLADGIMLPIFILVIIGYFRINIEIPAVMVFFSLLFVILSLLLMFFIVWGKKMEEKILGYLSWLPAAAINRLSGWYNQLHEGAITLKDPTCFSKVLVLSILAFFTDSAVFYLLFLSFGWSLPFAAAIITCIFIFVGSALPSTPGYFGLYQVACILALHPFGIPETSIVAYSLVTQCIAYTIFFITGGLIISNRKISLRTLQFNNG